MVYGIVIHEAAFMFLVQSRYFFTFTWVNWLTQYFNFYLSIFNTSMFTSTKVQHVCTFVTFAFNIDWFLHSIAAADTCSSATEFFDSNNFIQLHWIHD